MDSYNIKSDSVNMICKYMYEAISLSGQFAFALEDKEMYDELDILKRQTACCFKVLSETINLLEEAKYERLNYKVFNIASFVEDIVSSCRSKLRKTKIDLIFEEDFMESYVNIDPDRFSVCLLNLIVNSLANVDRDEGVVKVSVKHLYSDVRVQIIDNGYGMTSQKASEFMNSETPGGFSILKKFCEAFGASVIFETSENGGFSIALKIPTAGGTTDLHSSRVALGDGTFSAANILLSKLDYLEIDGIY